MGNAQALKITGIDDNNLVKEIVFSDNRRVLPFVHFIVKINKYFVENFMTGTIVREFTIRDLLRDKEFSIAIDRVESGLFFEGLQYSLESPPKIVSALFITKVVENSPAALHKVKAHQTILIGNESIYFNNFQIQ